MIPLVITLLVVIAVLLWYVIDPVDGGASDLFGLDAFYHLMALVLRGGLGLIVWLFAMLIWALWFR